MSRKNPKVLVIATSRKTRGGITSVVKAHETGEQWKNYNCRWIQTHRDGNPIRKLAYLFSALIQYLALLPFYDIVHIHLATSNSAKRKELFLYPAKWLRKKVILHFHPSDVKLLFESGNKKRCRRMFLKADLILVLSEQWKRWIQEAWGISNSVEVLYNPCPEVNRQGNIQEKNILFAGTLIQRKGYDVLIKAFALAHQKYPDWKLVFAGNGEIEEASKISMDLEIRDCVVFLGWIKGKEKEDTFQKASIYCLASIGEGFPMGVLDAWAYGIPCIVTPVGGIPDIIEDGINGLVFPIGDFHALSAQLIKLMENENLRESIVREADKYVFNEFNVKTINKKLDLIYQQVFHA